MNVQEQLLSEKTDPHLTDTNLTELARKALGARVDATGYRILTGGCWNRVIAVAVDGYEVPEIVCKISPHDRDERIIREHAVLSYFDRHSDMPVPQPLLIESSGTPVPGTVLLMTMVPGDVMHACFRYLDRAGREAVSAQIAEAVTELHTHRGTGFGGVELDASDRHAQWADFWLPRFDSAIEEVHASGSVEQSMFDEIAALRPRFHELLDVGTQSTLTHYDIWSGNVMIDVSTSPPRVTGYIDIPGFFADYARELSFMLMFGVADEDFFEVYRRRHDLDEGFSDRVSLYNLKMHLKHISMYPGERYYREGARQCLDHVASRLT